MHTYMRIGKGKLASFEWVTNKIMDNTINNQKMKLRDVINMVKKNHMAKVSINKACQVRKKAIEKLKGRYDE